MWVMVLVGRWILKSNFYWKNVKTMMMMMWFLLSSVPNKHVPWCLEKRLWRPRVSVAPQCFIYYGMFWHIWPLSCRLHFVLDHIVILTILAILICSSLKYRMKTKRKEQKCYFPAQIRKDWLLFRLSTNNKTDNRTRCIRIWMVLPTQLNSFYAETLCEVKTSHLCPHSSGSI